MKCLCGRSESYTITKPGSVITSGKRVDVSPPTPISPVIRSDGQTTPPGNDRIFQPVPKPPTSKENGVKPNIKQPSDDLHPESDSTTHHNKTTETVYSSSPPISNSDNSDVGASTTSEETLEKDSKKVQAPDPNATNPATKINIESARQPEKGATPEGTLRKPKNRAPDPIATLPASSGTDNQDTRLLTVPPKTISGSDSDSSMVPVGNTISGRKDSIGDLLEGGENVSIRRQGVQASVPSDADVASSENLPSFPKSTQDADQIKKAIEKNEFLSRLLYGNRLQDIIDGMQLRAVTAKKTLIRQGDKGSEMFVSKQGKYRILIKGKPVDEFNDSRVFGELALLYNAKRLATIQALTEGQVWVLDRITFQRIVIRFDRKEQDQNLQFLRNVDSLKAVNEDVLLQVSKLFKKEFFPPGSVIVRQGDKGDKFYVILAGTVTITKNGTVLGNLGKDNCFGEMALQKEDTRQATVTAEPPGVECLTLTRRNFIDHFGDVQIPTIQVKTPSLKDVPSEFQDVLIADLKIIRTLGVGGFGRVELVQHKKQKTMVFALKYLKKIEIVYQNQQEHVYNEKIIQMNCSSPFIARLYRTFKDNKYVYFLMEACLGGDLFTLLHKQKSKRFDQEDAQFLSACVLEALEHLHSKGIVYRDLKPENLLVDKNGYLKLTDFGFAKKMPPRGKTYTFAGTPEYVAPEIVLNRGHDRAVDYWAFGTFLFELLTGKTPFRTGDSSHMRTYNKILNGIDNVTFPTYVNLKAKNLIEKLCRPVASDRLGMQKGGIGDIKAHKWYQGFDWQKFQQQQIISRFKPKLKELSDTSNCDVFKQDKDYPPDETSGWDVHF